MGLCKEFKEEISVKTNKPKLLSIAFYSLVVTLWSDAHCMDLSEARNNEPVSNHHAISPTIRNIELTNHGVDPNGQKSEPSPNTLCTKSSFTVSQEKEVKDLLNSPGVKARLGLYEWLTTTGHIDVIERIIRGSGKDISSLFSQAGVEAIKDPASYTKQINLGSYNYSGLANDPRVIQASNEATNSYGVSLSGVRLLNGTTDLHRCVEQQLADFIGAESAVTYASGFVANIAAISSFFGENDFIFSDALNHQSIVDGINLSKARFIKYPHNDMTSLEAELKKVPFLQRKLIVTDSVFSMDGDIADVQKIIELAEEYNAFTMVDEAHGIGGYGSHLKGVVADKKLASQVDLITGSLSKGLPGGVGGFVLGKKKVIDILRFISNGYIFSASLPPSTLAGLSASLDILTKDEERWVNLSHNQAYLRAELKKLGLRVPEGNTPIIPIIFSDDRVTYTLCRELHKRGVFVNAVRYPAVPRNASRIRLNITASLSHPELIYALEKFKEVLEILPSLKESFYEDVEVQAKL